MSTTTLNIRFQQKIDTLANWESTNPILLNGEVAYVVVPATENSVVQTPATLCKVGDGTSKFKELDYSGALASDVHDWAKSDVKPKYTAEEVEGLADYITGEVEDTDTQYQVVKVDDYTYKLQSKTLNGAWSDVSGSKIVIPEADMTELETAVTKNTADISTNTTAIAILNGTGEGSVAKVTADAVASIVAGADEKYDTLKEIADWISNDATGSASMANSITALENLVGDTAVATQIAEAIDDVLNGDEGIASKYALAEELTALADRVATLEDKVSTWDAAEQNAKDYADGLANNTLTSSKEYTDSVVKTATDNLSTVATSGDIGDLVQADGEYVVFSCGSATVNI